MKKNIFRVLWLVTFVIFILSVNSGFCATYYVKNSGDDSASGLSDGSAWQTIFKVNSTGFNPGDSILFKRGGVWREQLTVTSSGSEGKPITYSAYGTGNNPEINGADIVTGWTVYSGDIYVADVDYTVKDLYVNGTRQQMARWPNTGWETISSTTGYTEYLASNALTQADDYWIDAVVVARTELYRIVAKKITGSVQADKKIIWSGNRTTRKDWGFYILNKFEELDAEGEWYYDSSGGKIYWQVPNGHSPNEYTIEGTTRDQCIYVNAKNYIDIKNITTRYGEYGIHLYHSSHHTVDSCKFYSNRFYGLRGSASESGDVGYITASNNYFSKIGYRSIYFSNGKDMYVQGNEIIDNCITSLPCYTTDSTDVIPSALAVNHADGGEISGNTINGSAYHGISMSGADNYTIERNKIEDCLKLLDDGGAIYVTGTSLEADDFSNTIIRYNFVKNSIGYSGGTTYENPVNTYGLYSDDYADDLEWYGNISIGCASAGALLHNAVNNKWYNNTFYNNGGNQLYVSGPGNNGNYIKNNIFNAVGADQYTFAQSSDTKMESNVYDYNVHYAPGNATPIRWRCGGGYISYNLSDWQSIMGHDIHSISSNPLFVNETGNFSQPSDFKLKPDSLCIDAGINVDLSRDFDGNTIPYGDVPDIGAFEYTVGPNPPGGIKVELIKD